MPANLQQPASLQQTLRAMAHNNAFANHRLLAACARLQPGEFAAPRSGFFPSICATLNHSHTVDLFYIDAIEGGTYGPAAWAVAIPHPALPDLAAAQKALDLRLITACGPALDPDRIVQVHRTGSIQRDRCDRLLLHLFQHQIHHRGQAHAMLSGTSVAPPQLDEFFCEGEADLRAADFAALGWTETQVWGVG